MSARVAPHIILTPLPLGGAIMMDKLTLGTAELGEAEMTLLRSILEGAERPQGELVEQMRHIGWLIVEGND
ncbi:actinodefensin-associated protein B [Microbispora hainanensis]|uniref:Actinodefensin-associated protein B n=1 Tax=Microbispora hainanensis TaxID=568844 RepID=A0ABZ1SMC3_9ACTN|nr:actinodefensin-associated protein B [Microbispora hainanensis]